MKVYKVEEVNTHGGSLRVYATMNKNKRAHKSMKEYIEIEKKNKLDKIETYYKFASDVEKIKLSSLKKIEGIISNNEKIIGYGAPAKATTVLNYFGINNLHFEYTIDDNHLKQNKFIPGTNIQIKSIDDIEPDIYDNVVVLAWNFFNEIKRKNSKIFKNAKFLKLK
tara:strand:- start:338 stop:835 length:498 start_codon:yes stop_codon:yes gene_type:complete